MIEWFLHKGERIIHKFDDLKVPLFLTNTRIILTKTSWGSMSFQDIGLNHLASIKAKKEISWWLIIPGAISLIFGLWLQSNIGFFGVLAIIFGIIFMAVGFLMGHKEVVFIADSGDRIAVVVKNKQQIEKTIKTVREQLARE